MGRHSISAGPVEEPRPATVGQYATGGYRAPEYATGEYQPAAYVTGEYETHDGPPVDGRSGLPHRRHHRSLWIATVVFWLIGLAAGFVATLVVGARVGCVAGAKGLACTDGGSALGVFLVLAVVVVVGVCTVFAFEARDHLSRWARYFGVGLILLVVVVVAARMLSSTL
ncbi:MAG: hypothetical protein JWM76_2087 [Pseudonocardiales bacterium]|nr:hypothetical protein [Pseudonocardiales bacterium]